MKIPLILVATLFFIILITGCFTQPSPPKTLVTPSLTIPVTTIPTIIPTATPTLTSKTTIPTAQPVYQTQVTVAVTAVRTAAPSEGGCPPGKCWVNGYYRKTGVYVHGYCRSC
jgi:hypothetical protein